MFAFAIPNPNSEVQHCYHENEFSRHRQLPAFAGCFPNRGNRRPSKVAIGQTSEPSREPILRIETGMHSSQIWHIGIDGSNHFLVSASSDKTVRVWEISTGRLLRVLRPPIGNETKSEVTAVAISPDGMTVASGGTSHEGSNTVHIFDRSSGQIVRTLPGLPDRILYLAYSKDGKYLVVTTARTEGIHIYRTNDYLLVGSDSDYGERCTAAVFDRQGRLATASEDGYVRLYGIGFRGSLNLVTKQKLGGNGYPADVDFDPTGSKIAVAFSDTTRVEVISGHDLSHLFDPDVSGETQGAVRRVAWSADGHTLYGAGYHRVTGGFAIRAWSDAGRGTYRDIPVADYQVTHLVALREGGVAYSSADPSVGIADKGDLPILIAGRLKMDYEANWPIGRFLVDAQARKVRFNYDRQGLYSGVFDLTTRQLTVPAGLRSTYVRRLARPEQCIWLA